MALQPAAKVLAEKMIAKESARLAATGVAGEQLAKQAVSNVAAKIGQTAALAGTAVGMEGGEIYGGLVEKAAQEGRSLTGGELAKATGATLGAGALEFVGDKIGLDLVLGKSVAGKLVSSRLGQAAAAGGLGTVTESGTEFTQTLLEEFGKGNDPFAPESIKQAVDSAAMGGVGGLPGRSGQRRVSRGSRSRAVRRRGCHWPGRAGDIRRDALVHLDYFQNQIFCNYVQLTQYRHSFIIEQYYKMDREKNVITSGGKKVNIDETDFKILKLLSKDSRIPSLNIAKNLNISVDTVNNKIKKMRC